MKISFKNALVMMLCLAILFSIVAFSGCGDVKKPDTNEPIKVSNNITSEVLKNIDVSWFDTGTKEIDIKLYPWEKTILPITLTNNSAEDMSLDFDCDSLWGFYGGVSSEFYEPLVVTPDFAHTINLPVSFSFDSDPYGIGTETIEILITNSEIDEPIVLIANIFAKNTDNIPLATKVWEAEIDAFQGGILKTFVTDENFIVVVDTVRENRIPEEYICFDRATGTQKWTHQRYDLGEGFFGDEAYTYKAFIKPEQNKLIVFESEKIFCLDVSSGEKLWEIDNIFSESLFELEMYGDVFVSTNLTFTAVGDLTKEPVLSVQFDLETGEYIDVYPPDHFVYDEKFETMMTWSEENQDILFANEDLMMINVDNFDEIKREFFGGYEIVYDKFYQTAATFGMGDFYYHTSIVCYDRLLGDELYFWDFGWSAHNMNRYQIWHPVTTTLWSLGDWHHVFAGNYVMNATTGELEYLLDREQPNQLNAAVFEDSVYSWEQAEGEDVGLGGMLVLKAFELR